MSRPHSVDIVGGGPAGLYTAILLRRKLPQVAVRVTEQNAAEATFGFGVVFSDQALGFLDADDPDTHALVRPHMEAWQSMTLNHPDGTVVLDGVGFTAIGRLTLLQLLQEEARALGAELRYGTRIVEPADLDGDLVIGADGVNSVVRAASEAAFAPQTGLLSNRFAWFGTPRPFDTLTQTFLRTGHGALNAHHYRYAPDASTFIVECDAAGFAAHGFDRMDEEESAAVCARLFAEVLDGAPLITNRSTWRQFPLLWCKTWASGRYALIGDAAHTAHFSVGSGTRLAMEDALALVRALETHDDTATAFAAYQAERPPIAQKIVRAATTSARWYESFASRIAQPPLDFAHDYLTRSGRIDRTRLRTLAPKFMARYDSERSGIDDPVGDDTPGAREIGFRRADHPNCSEILWRNLSRNPGKIAVTGPAGQCTYADLIAQASRWGHAFRAAGLAQGDRIPMFLDDTPAYPAAFFGAVRAGFVPVLLNIQTPADTLAYFLKDSGARLVVTEAALADRFGAEVLSGTGVQQIVAANGAAQGCVSEATFLDGRPTTLDVAPTGPDDMAFWMYSSGSTGRPKGIVHLHHDMAYTEASYGRQVLNLQPDDVCFSVPKIYFAYGFGNAITFPFSVGATTVLLPGQPHPGAILDAIEAFRPTVLFALPTVYTALARAEGVERRDLASLRMSVSAAETLSEDVYTRWKTLAGHGPTEGLGSTEMLHIYLSNRDGDHRIGAAGARVPGYEVRLITPEGADAADGEDGVMMVRGHSQAPMYWNRPDKTAETMRDGWIWTGDRFTLRDGFYYFLGRADDLIKVSGQWVWPQEVERCLNDHPDVHECAVLPHRLDDGRTTLRAVVALRAGRSGDAERTRALQDHVKQTLQPHKYPRIVEYRRELPKTGTGKIDRQALTPGP